MESLPRKSPEQTVPILIEAQGCIQAPTGPKAMICLATLTKYLVRHFATESRKSKGQFYTQPAVRHLLESVCVVQERRWNHYRFLCS